MYLGLMFTNLDQKNKSNFLDTLLTHEIYLLVRGASRVLPMAAMLEYNGLYMIFAMKLSLSIPSVKLILDL